MPGPSATARSYAAVRTVAAAPSTSPESSMTAVPGSTRVVASHALVMCRTSSSHGQPDGVPLAVRRYLHRVDHVADEEQSPAARALVAVEFPDEIGLFGLLGLVGLAGPGRRLVTAL